MILETKAPLKERYVRNNRATFMNKNLQTAIKNPFRLLNRYRKEKTKATRPALGDREIRVWNYKKRPKKEIYNNSNAKHITDSVFNYFGKT